MATEREEMNGFAEIATPRLAVQAIVDHLAAERLADRYSGLKPLDGSLAPKSIRERYKESQPFQTAYEHYRRSIYEGEITTNEALQGLESKMKGGAFEWFTFLACVERFSRPDRVVLSPEDARTVNRVIHQDVRTTRIGTDQETSWGRSTLDFYIAERKADGHWKITAAVECTTTNAESHIEKKPKALAQLQQDFPDTFSDASLFLFLPKDAGVGAYTMIRDGVRIYGEETPISRKQIGHFVRGVFNKYRPSEALVGAQSMRPDDTPTLEEIFREMQYQRGRRVYGRMS